MKPTRRDSGAHAEAPWQNDGAGFEYVADPARELFALPEPLAAFAGESSPPEEILDSVVTLEHDVPIEDGETLRVRESFTLRSWIRRPKRAVLFITTTAVTASLWEIPDAAYNGPEMAARKGFFAYTVDYIGVGPNYRPSLDARDSTFERNLEALKAVVRYIRFSRAVPRVDLMGESWGGAHATQLAADPDRIRSCVMSSMAYKATNPMFLSPEFGALLESLPANFMPSDPDLIVQMTAGAPDPVKDYVRETQVGMRLTTQLWQFQKGLPHFDPSAAKVPGLVISGPPEAADHRALAADYGGAEYFEIGTAAHAPRLESPETVTAFWTKVFEFLEAPPSGGN
ncbi:MAG: alpha/beta hydrolase [bacterium]|nr:alpha/beta hydrolase [bacterium]